MPKSKWFLFLYSIVLLLLAINLAVEVPFIFTPITVALSSIAPVIIVGGVLYYILRPLVNLLEKYMPTVVSILLIFLTFIGAIAALVTFVGPIIVRQAQNFADNVPNIISSVEQWINDMMTSEWMEMVQGDQLLEDFDPSVITDNLTQIAANFGGNIASILGMIFSIIMLIVVLPFVLFFLLKDAQKLPESILGFLPSDQEDEGKKIMSEMDGTLSAYIQGQAIVSFCVGILSLILYLIIGLDYALVLALVAMLTNLIPFVGPFIGTIPAVFVAFFDAPITALWVILGIVVIQQIESNLISPNVMGHKLHIHPLTIILLLLLAGNLAGLIGLILAIPAYAVSKVIVQNVYRLLKLKYPNLR
ncbi:AI-2E family transporter [Alkalicoccus daliensis]|uniref:Predicted PurR-regulated permease PerM n=1 Tax=Alkalicoccus daliensis TaxID=745820 RepID=A0A1H0AMW5_9BACI|nr:AI-2E family transporter [Alkalicoccus daliensis]SDN34624.1 Predicted PurR-regulated permease PerM [Alkalicoccus daliensis]